MDEQSKKILDQITSLSPKVLSKEQIAFLNGRRGYLRPEQKLAFKSVLIQDEEPVEEATEPTTSKKVK